MPSKSNPAERTPRVTALVVLEPEADAPDLSALQQTLDACGGGELICVGDAGDGEHASVTASGAGLGALLGHAAEGAAGELLLICQHGATVGAEDLAAMIECIDARFAEPAEDSTAPPAPAGAERVDLVVGRRPQRRRGMGRRLRDAAFGVPVADMDCGVVLARRQVLADIPLHSGSSFAVIELAAKANFMGHVLDEVPLSADTGAREPIDPAQRRADAKKLFREPDFPVRRPSEKPDRKPSRRGPPAPPPALSVRSKPQRRPRRPRGKRKK